MTPVAGQSLECEVKVDGKWSVITKMMAVGGAAMGAGTVSGGGGGMAPWWAPFCSNVVAHAIEAGKIEGPADIAAWATAAMDAIVTLVDQEPKL